MQDADPPLDLEIFLVAPPGLEGAVAAEAHAAGFAPAQAVPGGVVVRGGWPEVWRANLVLRGPGRVLVRFAAFRAMHLAQLDKRARRVPWATLFHPGQPLRVEAVCHASRIYHAGAAKMRIERALIEEAGAQITADADLRVLARIEDDLCTLSLDSSGAALHKRGHKQAVGKAPLRETMAAMFLAQAGFGAATAGVPAGAMPVIDPMCGSGTFPIEAAEIAAGLTPGRARHFGFERLANFEAAAFAKMHAAAPPAPAASDGPLFFGYDRDQGAIANAAANAARAGVGGLCHFACQPIGALYPPAGLPPGLVIFNPPYGTRIGARKPLFALYASAGVVLRERFAGWRVAMVCPDMGLAKTMGLPFLPDAPWVEHGGIKVRLLRTDALPA